MAPLREYRSERPEQEPRPRFGFPCSKDGCQKFFYGATKKQSRANRRKHWQTVHGVFGLPCGENYCSRVVFYVDLGDREGAEALLNRHQEDHGDPHRIRCDEDPQRCQKVFFGATEDRALDKYEDHLEQDHGVEFEDDDVVEAEAATA